MKMPMTFGLSFDSSPDTLALRVRLSGPIPRVGSWELGQE